MKDRLIELLDGFVLECVNNCPKIIEGTKECHKCAYGKIADYLLADGWFRPPCKVGDKVYVLRDGKVINYFVLEISKHYNGTMYFEVIPQDTRGCPQWFNLRNRFANEDIGKTVFLTREEAEKALRKDEGK